MAIWDLDQELRSTVKYEKSLLSHDGKATDAEIEIADKLREKIREILEGYQLNIEM